MTDAQPHPRRDAAEPVARGASPTVRWVALCHDLPDGSWHVDWLIDDGAGSTDRSPAGDDAHCLVGLRLPRPLAELEPGAAMTAERLEPHRRRYLDYEGAIGRGRGAVRRVDGGTLRWLRRDAGRWRVELLGADGEAGAAYDVLLPDGAPVTVRAAPR